MRYKREIPDKTSHSLFSFFFLTVLIQSSCFTYICIYHQIF